MVIYVIYMVICVDNSHLGALQKKPGPQLAGPARGWSPWTVRDLWSEYPPILAPASALVSASWQLCLWRFVRVRA